jgi:hypothetical protein
MIIKFILLTTICWNFSDVGTQCTQYLDMEIKNAEKCREEATAIGKSYKKKIIELGGSMEEYRAQCMAIDKDGYNVDHSFNISYTIL